MKKLNELIKAEYEGYVFLKSFLDLPSKEVNYVAIALGVWCEYESRYSERAKRIVIEIKNNFEGFLLNIEKQREAEAEEKAERLKKEEIQKNTIKKQESEKWQSLLKETDLTSNEVAIKITEVLSDPDECDPSWFKEAVYSVSSNIEMEGELSKLADEEGWDYEMIRKAIAAKRRHEDTNYDHLLKKGFTRDEARDFKS